MTSSKTNKKPYDIIQPGEPVVLLTYVVGLCPDGEVENEYEPIPVHLRKRPSEVNGDGTPENPGIDTAHPDEALRAEILKRAEKLERRDHPTPKERTFTLGTVRLSRQRLDVAR